MKLFKNLFGPLSFLFCPVFYLEGADGGGDGSGGGDGGGDGGEPVVSSEVWNAHQLMKEDGSFVDNWLSHELTPDGLKEHVGTLSRYPNLNEVGKALGEAHKALSERIPEGMVQVPGEDAEGSTVEDFRLAVGAPAEAKEYGLSVAPEGQEETYDTVYGEKIEGILHKHHATTGLAKELAEAQAEREGAAATAHTEARENWLEAENQKLRDAWGNDHDVKLDEANRLLKAHGYDPEQCPPALKKIFAQYAPLAFEDARAQKVLGLGDLPTTGGDPAARALQLQKTEAYQKGDPTAQKEVMDLLALAHKNKIKTT